jgi:VanZ family protein
MALIFWLSSRAVPSRLDPLLPDKIVHACVYAGLSALLVRALAGGWRGTISMGQAAAAAALAALYGMSDELHQSFVPARDADMMDLLADTIGAIVAASSLHAWGIIRARNVL